MIRLYVRKGTLAQGSPVDYGLIHTNPLKGWEGVLRWVKTGGCQDRILCEENTFALSAPGLSLG